MTPDQREWTGLQSRVRFAQIEQDILRNPDTSQIDRDLALVRYGRALGAVAQQLERMAETGLLGRINLLLARGGL